MCREGWSSFGWSGRPEVVNNKSCHKQKFTIFIRDDRIINRAVGRQEEDGEWVPISATCRAKDAAWKREPEFFICIGRNPLKSPDSEK
jgi:hypothetical protein